MERADFERWIEGYERAWRSVGTAALADLFSADASYVTAPFEAPHIGLDTIAELWEEERHGHDEPFEMSAQLLAVEGDTGVARVEVVYGAPIDRNYLDIWVIRLDDDGRCRVFEEWPFWPPDDDGTYRSGPDPNPSMEESENA